jgi:hypothetical protein
MAVTVFVWDMFKYRSGDGIGVGHTSMYIHGGKGSIYISFWPSAHSLRAGWFSPGVVHFINGDIKADGKPSWASKPISTLNEPAIISWWSRVQHNPLLDYRHKTPTQVSGAAHASAGNTYSILFNQCSITVVKALMVGADSALRAKISAWLMANAGSTPYLLHVPTVTPRDVRSLVEAVF